MDFHLMQWRNHVHESEEQQQYSTNMPKLLPGSHQHPQSSASSAFPLFVPETNTKVSTHLSDSTLATTTRFPRMGSYFSLRQLQELELQALIYRYMLAGASVPPELLQPIKKSLLHSPNTPYFLHHHSLQHYQPAAAALLQSGMRSYFSLGQWQELELQALIFRYMLAGAAVPPELLQPIKKSLLHSPNTPYFLHHHSLQHYYQPAAAASVLQSGNWGRGAMDPAQGRCRRKDGKKWRCSREVVVDQKYCERHMNRGKKRSSKPVELPTPTTGGGGGGSLGASPSSISSPPLATASLKYPFDPHHLSERFSGTKNESKSLYETPDHMGGDGRSGGHMLRHFFDDWPRSLQQSSDNAENNSGFVNSETWLNISMPENTSSDVSLKLFTGYGEETCPRNGNVDPEAEQLQLNWDGGWTSTNQVAPMGGPLAEALIMRSST